MNSLLTTSEVAKALGMSRDTVYGYIKRGELKASKPGGYTRKKHWRIKLKDFEAFINRKETQPTSEDKP
ncbi:hypothetical protein ES704_01945 [subsurface metagenome]|jgi:excisionase family DNA binding protein